MNDNILYHALYLGGFTPRRNPPFSLVEQRSPLGSARSGPGREAAERTLDGEDRFGTIHGEGKGGECSRGHACLM